MERIEVTQEEISKLAELYLQENLGQRSIAKAMNRSVAWCTRVLKENGLYIDNPEGYAANSSELVSEVARLKKEKWNNGVYELSVHKPFFEPNVFYTAICKTTQKQFGEEVSLHEKERAGEKAGAYHLREELGDIYLYELTVDHSKVDKRSLLERG